MLLKSALDFLDVNDAAAVNKILDEAANSHAKRAMKRNPLRSEGKKVNKAGSEYVTKDVELEEALKGTLRKEDEALRIEEVEEPLLEPLPSHIVKGYYTLRHLKARNFKIKLLHALNYMRSVQRRLTYDMLEMGTRDKLMGDVEVIGSGDEPPQ